MGNLVCQSNRAYRRQAKGGDSPGSSRGNDGRSSRVEGEDPRFDSIKDVNLTKTTKSQQEGRVLMDLTADDILPPDALMTLESPTTSVVRNRPTSAPFSANQKRRDRPKNPLSPLVISKDTSNRGDPTIANSSSTNVNHASIQPHSASNIQLGWGELGGNSSSINASGNNSNNLKTRTNAACSSTPKIISNHNNLASLDDGRRQPHMPGLHNDSYFTEREKQEFEKPTPKVGPSSSRIEWRKGEVIGRGAYGTVYVGLNVGSAELMAVKEVQIIPKGRGSVKHADTYVAALEREIAMLSGLRHPNIVRYIGTDRDTDHLYIFLEYVSGGSIASLLKTFGPFDEKVTSIYTKHILNGLHYLHSHRIIHRDIKGGNILIDAASGCPKLADFGAAKKLAELSETAQNPKSLHGTPYWMAPEVIQQTGHGRQADIWSLGCTVIEMLTGKPPWHQYRTQVSALFHIASANGPPDLPDGISELMRDLLLQCLQRNAKKRPNALSLLSHPLLREVSIKTTTQSTTMIGDDTHEQRRNQPEQQQQHEKQQQQQQNSKALQSTSMWMVKRKKSGAKRGDQSNQGSESHRNSGTRMRKFLGLVSGENETDRDHSDDRPKKGHRQFIAKSSQQVSMNVDVTNVHQESDDEDNAYEHLDNELRDLFRSKKIKPS